MRKTKIVCTIGPTSESIEVLEQMIGAGMNVARLNFSHGNFTEHEARIKNIKEAARRTGKTVAILLDTKGPEVRTGKFKREKEEIVEGNILYICMDDILGTNEQFSVTYPNLIDDVEIGSTILIDDGLIELEVLERDHANKKIKVKALNSGQIKDNKGVNIPNAQINLPGLTEKDVEDIIFGIKEDVDFIAGSFIRRQSDVMEIKEVLEKHHAGHIHIISKIENREGVDNIDSILEVCDGVMVARGDLGVEIPPEDVPLVQKDLISKCNIAGKPVITATQMLDSMQRNPRPTRAEASDVANAIFDGTDAVMLSGETAAGDYPVESVQTMSNIAMKTETGLDNQMILKNRSKLVDMTITDSISQSVTHTALNLGVGAIITPTESGHTARMISKYRPEAPIIAVTFTESVNRQLALVCGVQPVMGTKTESTDEMLDIAIDSGLSTGLVKRGDKVVITAGVPVGESGTTNLMKIHVIGDVIGQGQGVGRRSAYGNAVRATTAKEAIDKIKQDDILVTISTDSDMMPALKRAGGIVTEEGGLTNHAAVVGLSLGIPVIVGVKGAMDLIEDGKDITIDSSKGTIYEGHASVL